MVGRLIRDMDCIIVVRTEASIVRVCCIVEAWKWLVEVKIVHINSSSSVDDRLAVIGLHHADLIMLALLIRGLFLDDKILVGGTMSKLSLLLLRLDADLLETVVVRMHVIVLVGIFPVGVDREMSV